MVNHITKEQINDIVEFLDSSSFNFLDMGEDIRQLEMIAKYIFESRPSEIPYVVPLLEYSIRVQTVIKNPIPYRDFLDFITEVLFIYSDFHPVRRFIL